MFRSVLPASFLVLVVLPGTAMAQHNSDAERKAYEAGNAGSYMSSTASEAERRAYDNGVSDRERSAASAAEQAQRSAEMQKWQAEHRAEMEAIRAEVLKQPPLAVAKNPLLGRWIQVGPKQQGLMAVILDPEAAYCSMIFGGDAFEYRPDALVLDMDGEDVVVDQVTFRAGKRGSVFALGEKNIRLLLFEFEGGPDRMSSGKCVYARVKRTSSAGAAAAKPAPEPAVGKAAPAVAKPTPTTPRAYAGAGFRIAGATLGTDTPPSVSKAIAGRGGLAAPSVMEPGVPLRIYGRDANWDDVGQGIYNVAFDFDEDGPGGQLVAVTLVQPADAAGLPSLLQRRAAALAAKHGPLTETAPTRREGRSGAVRIILEIDATASAVLETYRLN